MSKLLSGAAMAVACSVLLGGNAFAGTPTYSFDTTISIPADAANPLPGGLFSTFDISYFDPTTGLDYVADRSNAAVDIFSGSTLTFVGRATGFAGQQSSNAKSGADGVVVVNNGTQHTLFAGDGPSTLRSYNVSGSLANPPTQFPTLNTGGSSRVDEMAYSPSSNLVLVANNADAPAFGTLVNASTGKPVSGKIVIPGAAPTDGLEQPVWDPNTNSFFISVPAFGGGTDPGGIAEIRTNGTVGKLIRFASFGISSCAPTGLAIGASGNLLVGCGNAGTQTVLVNPAANTAKTITGVSGSDELYYDPFTSDFFATGVNSSNGRVFDVIADNGTGSILQSVALPNVNAHSISVDPLNGDVFVPLPGGSADPLCSKGCIAVFSESVSEPGGLALFGIAVAALGVVGVTRRR